MHKCSNKDCNQAATITTSIIVRDKLFYAKCALPLLKKTLVPDYNRYCY